jgi:hypothetical protein
VPADHERDRSLEHLLRQGLRPEPPTRDACVDAETLAAWMSGSLPRHRAGLVETHVSSCARCQAMVAAFARTEPPASARVSWIERWHLRWVVPLATAATAVAIWIAIPDRAREMASIAAPPEEQQTAAVRPRQPEDAPAESARPEAGLDRAAPSSPLAAPAAATPPEKKETLAAAGQPAGNIAPLQDSASSDRRNREAESRDRFAARSDANEADKPQARDERQVSGVTSPAPARAPAPVAGDQAFRRAAPGAQNKPAEEPAAKATQEAITVSGARPMASGVIVEILSPDKSSRWRIVDHRQVQQSTDGGTTWQPTALAAPADLTAGHAPGGTVCWVVGRRGIIFVTSDGTHFEPVPFVETGDLVKVTADSDRRASVTTADGRVFRTTDRGATWTRAGGGPQEIF